MKRGWAVLRKALLAAGVLLPAGLIAAVLFFFHYALDPFPREAKYNADRSAKLSFPLTDGRAARTPEVWTLTARDGAQLAALYVAAEKPSTRTVLLAHGYGGQPEEMVNYAAIYWQDGYNLLLPYARAHYRSGGQYVGFGWLERNDWIDWIKAIITRGGTDSQLVLHGASMGAATVLMVSGEDLPPQVRAVVADSAYTSLEDEFRVRMNADFGLPAFPVLQLTGLFAKWQAGYAFSEASTLKQVARSRTPTLVIHGTQDSYVPTEMATRLYDACSAPKQLALIKGAGHTGSLGHAPGKYAQLVRNFLKAYITTDSGSRPDAPRTGN